MALTLGGWLLVAFLVPRVVSERRESAATLAWVLAIVFMPFVGALLYWAFGVTRLRRKRVRRRRCCEGRTGGPRAETGAGRDGENAPLSPGLAGRHPPRTLRTRGRWSPGLLAVPRRPAPSRPFESLGPAGMQRTSPQIAGDWPVCVVGRPVVEGHGGSSRKH
ncbi:MAG: PLDc_N domain-containing protein [Planctomycetes bacterium]|nr:PLDc_N domain-containing protein [Planctomycetota bacterium]